MNELEFRLKRLFIFSHGLEEMEHRYDVADLYRLLLDEVVELETEYEAYKQMQAEQGEKTV